MIPDAPNTELRELLEALCRDELTREQQTRLQQLVRGDEERRFYVHYLHMHICLRRAYGQSGQAPPLFDLPTPLARTAAQASGGLTPPVDTSPERPRRDGPVAGAPGLCPQPKSTGASRGLFGRWRRFVSLAASILVLIGCGLVWWMADRGKRASAAETVGVLTNAVGCVWEGSQTPTPGAKLQAGRLELGAGVAEITCAGGTVMLIEAPAVLDLFDAAHGFLHAGRIVLRMSPAASGFVLETHQVRLLDLGTEFGIDVSNSSDTLVQVFDGIVVADLRQDKGQARSQRLRAGQTVQIGDDAKLRPQASTPERFIRRFPVPSARDLAWPVPCNPLRYDRVHLVPAPARVTIDGDLSDWDRSGQFFAACIEPYAKDYHVQGCLMYDRQFLYVGAHVGDLFPMCSVIDPETDPRFGWRGGGVQVRLSTDRAFGWPLAGKAPPWSDSSPHPQDRSDHLVHLTMWYCKPKRQVCLCLEYGMDFHGVRTNPPGYRGAFRKDADGRGHTLEYAIPWEVLNARENPPRAGDVLGACWEVHWSDEEGRLWKGKLVDILNPNEKGPTFWRAARWGQAIYHPTGHLPPGSVKPR